MKLFKKKSAKKINQHSVVYNGHSFIRSIESEFNSKLYLNNDAAQAFGLALSGERAAVLFTSAANAGRFRINDISRFAHAPLVIHVPSDWADSEFLIYEQKYIILFCPSFNDLAHLTLLAHKIAEVLLEPVFLMHESDAETTYSRIPLPDFKLAKNFLGKPDDQIDSLISQVLLFGEKRRRIPQWIDYSRAMGLNPVYNESVAFKSRIARETFSKQSKIPEIKKVFETYNRQSVQNLNLLFNSNTDKAKQVFYGTGKALLEITSLLDKPGSSLKKHSGTIIPVLLSPFPAAEFNELTLDKKKIFIQNHSQKTDISKILKDENTYKCVVDENEFGYDHIVTLSNLLKNNKLNKLSYLVDIAEFDQARHPIMERKNQLTRKNFPGYEENFISVDKTTNQNFDDLFRVDMFFDSTAVAQPILENVTAYLNKNDFKYINSIQKSYHFKSRPFVRVTLHFSKTHYYLPVKNDQSAFIFSTSHMFLQKLSDFNNDGFILLSSSQQDKLLWKELNSGLRKQIKQENIRLCVLDAQSQALDKSVLPAARSYYEKKLYAEAIVQACLIISDESEITQKKNIFAIPKSENMETKLGFDLLPRIRDLDSAKLSDFEDLYSPDSPAPWTLSKLNKSDETVYDPAFFWNTTGFLFRSQNDSVLPVTPDLAYDVQPAGTASGRDFSPLHPLIPSLIAENCTACGDCWMRCPDSALQFGVTTPQNLFDYALEKAKTSGAQFLQLPRISSHIVKQAAKIIEQKSYSQSDQIFKTAFETVLEKMHPAEDQKKQLENEFNKISEHISPFPVITNSSIKSKNGTLLSSLVINPYSCKGCRACIEICPENALISDTINDKLIRTYQKNFETILNVKSLSWQELINNQEPEIKDSALFFNERRTASALTGGDNALPGNGVKSAIRQVCAAVEAHVRPQLQQLISKIDDSINRLEKYIQGNLQDSLKINEFDALHHALIQAGNEAEDPAKLLKIISEINKTGKPSGSALKQWTEVLQNLKHSRKLLSHGYYGNGFAPAHIVINSDEIATWTASFPYNPWSYPWVNITGSESPALIDGLKQGITFQFENLLKPYFQAEAVLRGEEISEKYTLPDNISFDPVTIFLWDIDNFKNQPTGEIIRLLNKKDPAVFCVINSLKDIQSAVSGENPAIWSASQQNCYTIQASPAYPEQLIYHIREGLKNNLSVFTHIHAVDPLNKGFESHMANQLEKLAVESRMFPLFSYNPLKSDYFGERFDLKGNPDFEQDWTSKPQTKKVSFNKPGTVALTPADWAIYDENYFEFYEQEKNQNDSGLIDIAEYINLEEKQRFDLSAVLTIEDGENQIAFKLGKELLSMIEQTRQFWNLLQELAGIRVFDHAYQEEKHSKVVAEKVNQKENELKEQYQAKINALENETFQIYHQKLFRNLVNLYKKSPDSDKAREALKKLTELK